MQEVRLTNRGTFLKNLSQFFEFIQFLSKILAILKDLEPKKHWNYLTQEGVLDYNDMDKLEAEKQEKPELNFFYGARIPTKFPTILNLQITFNNRHLL